MAALKAKQIDGLVVDLPTAFFITAVQVPNGKIVGQFPTIGSQEYFGMVLAKDSPLTECVNEALAHLKDSGELSADPADLAFGQGQRSRPPVTPEF